MQFSFDEYGNEILPEPKTVSWVNDYVKLLIEEEMLLQDIFVSGEISNFKKHSSGHFYFTLKDEKSEIRAVMFKPHAMKVKFAVENGLKVVVHARVSVYQQAGSYQLYVDSIVPEGIGELHFAYEQLKARLSKEGLFDEAHKKPIPKFPKKIGIITSPTGAAVRDIINVATRRYPISTLVLFPSLVQGEDAVANLIGGIEYFNITESVDVIIIGRGGGSIEDLWAFNDEYLARAIYNSKIPVISGVGHEIDFTICDFVADLRAATPSAAAELATPNIVELSAKIDNFKTRSINNINNKLEEYKSRLRALSSSRFLANPESMLETPKMRLNSCQNKLSNAFDRVVLEKKSIFKESLAKLNALNPLSVLSRGYAVVYNDDGKSIKSVEDIDINKKFNIKLNDGNVLASPISIERNNKNG
ncbi:MAG: exodeoxyribonuclease VII large subunit [Clostridia bacterium]|nr:exodeoxyribonuclease VII large subunit [Clostridia bacterium]